MKLRRAFIVQKTIKSEANKDSNPGANHEHSRETALKRVTQTTYL